jgi:hypothetical protein
MDSLLNETHPKTAIATINIVMAIGREVMIARGLDELPLAKCSDELEREFTRPTPLPLESWPSALPLHPVRLRYQ